MKLLNNLKAYHAKHKEERRLATEAEEERQQRILNGKIPSLKIDTIRLEDGEKAYFQARAQRLADVEHTVTVSTGKSKRKGVITRAVVGTVIAGPVGLLAGAATAGKQHNSQSVQHTEIKHEVIDTGTILFTNRRILFLGSQMVLIPYIKVVSMNTNRLTLALHYEGMINGEAYRLSGEMAKDVSLYYKGISGVVTRSLIKKSD